VGFRDREKKISFAVAEKVDNDLQGVRCIALKPNSDLLAVKCSKSPVTLWSIKTGKKEGKLEGLDISSFFLEFSRDGSLLAATTYGNKNVQLWNVRKDQEICSLPKGAQSLAFSPDGRILVTGGQTLSFWHVEELCKGE
jgi:WD40 repeat protein